MHMPYLGTFINKKVNPLSYNTEAATKLKFVQNINICKDH